MQDQKPQTDAKHLPFFATTDGTAEKLQRECGRDVDVDSTWQELGRSACVPMTETVAKQIHYAILTISKIYIFGLLTWINL